MSLCPICGMVYCDHTPEERGQTHEEMMQDLTLDELVAFQSNDPKFKLSTALRNRDLQHLPKLQIDIGVSCEDYSLLVIAGPSFASLPKPIRKKMQRHEEMCEYHRSKTWHQSALGTPITPALEKAAAEVIKKYSGQLDEKPA
jgi:hypothetical protein